MSKTNNFGVTARGIRLPIIKNGDNISSIICDNLKDIISDEGLEFNDNDIISITESLVARSFGNYVTVDDIANFIKEYYGEHATVGVLWPIYSRNRFGTILKGIARGADKVVVQLHHGKDEVGNDIVNPWTGVNIIEYYRDIIEQENAEPVIMQASDAYSIVPLVSGNVIISTIHSRNSDISNILEYIEWNQDKYNNSKVITLADIFSVKTSKHGFNEEYGLLGSNKCGDELLKLFPRKSDCTIVCENIKEWIKSTYNKDVHVMVYGDGCFKDPACGIWEFADPISCPYHTGNLLDKSPNELKIKYIADNVTSDVNEIKKLIQHKEEQINNNKMLSQGTTPRRFYDLVASLCDLVSGSGDRGCPVVWVTNYFKNYSD